METVDFTQMTRKALKAYIRQHPTNEEAIRELFINRRHPNAKVYPFPYDMTKEELNEVFRAKSDC